jgi:sugar phosphate isomerase/epimerase
MIDIHRIAISNIAWSADQDKTIYQLLKLKGISLIEIAPTRFWARPDQIQNEEVLDKLSELKQFGLSPIAMQSLLYGRDDLSIFDGPESKAITMAYLKRMVDIARLMGITSLIFGSPKNKLRGNLSHEEAMKLAVNFFEELCDYCKNIYFCIEPTSSIYGADFILNYDSAIDLISRVQSPQLKLNLDLGAVKLETQELSAVVERVLPFTQHIHISEPRLLPIEFNPGLHEQFARLIQNSNYRGPMSIEMKGGLSNDEIEKIIDFIIDTYVKK